MEQNVLIRDGFQAGMSIKVLSDAGKPLFTGRIKALEEGFVTLVHADGAALPSAAGKSEVRLHGQPADSRVAVYTGRVCLGSRILWKIDQLEGGPIQNRRQFYRQPVSLEAIVMLLGKYNGTDAAVGPSTCTILDISGGGLRMSCDEGFELGDHLLVAEVHVLEDHEPFNFGCEVRRVEEGGESRVYGCQFEGLSEQEQARLVNAMFLLQRKSRNRQAQ